MGRKLRTPTTDGDIVSLSGTGSGSNKKTKSEAALKRLGFGKNICMDCNARNPERAHKCRKCGSKQFREKKLSFHDT